MLSGFRGTWSRCRSAARSPGSRALRAAAERALRVRSAQPALFPGGRDPGATALKQAVSSLLGVRVDYYALVNLRGFADLVDGLGGVRILVKERLVDEVTRPAWGEPKPRIDVAARPPLPLLRPRSARLRALTQGLERLHPDGPAALLPLRDGGPTRPGARAPQLPRAGANGRAERATDVPLRRLPALIRLVGGIDPKETLTETFGADYIASRRKADNYPLPKLGLMRQTVREAILDPERASAAELARRRLT